MRKTRRPTREQMTQAVRRVAGDSPTVSRRTFLDATGYRSSDIDRHFDNWTDCVEAAGKQVLRPPRYDDDALFADMHHVLDLNLDCVDPGKFRSASRLSASPYKRFGDWPDALRQFVDWAKLHRPHWEMLDTVSARVQQYCDAAADRSRITGLPARFDGPFWGEPINDPVFPFAPTDESGVVGLFCAWAERLGFRIGRIGTGFPDCFAWERTRHRSRDFWQERRIEFEYVSKNFRDHGHDPAACDLIVCWEDDWPGGAPIRVLALKQHVEVARAA